jgi:hypothetical protein
MAMNGKVTGPISEQTFPIITSCLVYFWIVSIGANVKLSQGESIGMFLLFSPITLVIYLPPFFRIRKLLLMVGGTISQLDRWVMSILLTLPCLGLYWYWYPFDAVRMHDGLALGIFNLAWLGVSLLYIVLMSKLMLKVCKRIG